MAGKPGMNSGPKNGNSNDQQSMQRQQPQGAVDKIKDAVGLKTPDYKAELKATQKDLKMEQRKTADLTKTIQKINTLASSNASA